MALGFKPAQPTFLVNTETLYAQKYSEIVALGDNGYVVVWESEGQDTSASGVFAQMYDTFGNPVGSEFQVNTRTYNDQDDISVTALSNGGFVVSYFSDFDENDEGYGWHAQVYDASGTPSTGELYVSPPGNYSTAISDATGGGFVVISRIIYASGLTIMNKVVGQIYDASGNKVDARFDVTSGRSEPILEISVTTLTNGDLVVTWTTDALAGNYNDVFGQLIAQDGTMLGPEFQINTHATESQYESAVTPLSNGGFVVTYTTKGLDGSDRGIAAQMYDNTGSAVGSEILVNTTTIVIEDASDVAGLPDGGFIVVWNHDNDGEYAIYGQRFDASGGKVGDEYTIAFSNTHFSDHPSIAVLDNGSFMVTWDNVGTSHLDIFARSFKPQLFGTSGDDTLTDTVGADWISGRGGDDTLKGKSGKDTIFGGNGKDTLFGGGGRDKLYGGGGNDVIYGGSHNDKISGNGGKDTLTGGSGADTFIFKKASDSTTSKSDIITDFESGSDKLDFSGLSGGTLTYIDTAAFNDTANEVRITHTVNGNILVRIDLDGDGSADMRIQLTSLADINLGDFIL